VSGKENTMRHLHCASRLVLAAAALLGLAACTPKYAVLLSSNQTQFDDLAIHSEWWYDLVLQYKALKESGFTDDHIFVVYGDGTDFPTAHPEYSSAVQFGHSITDLPMNKANVQSVFATVNSKMTKPGYLYVWWMGHGGGSGPGQCDLTMQISNTGESVTDAELKSYVDAVTHYKKRSIAIMTCHSGGLVDNFAAAGEQTVVLASSTCAESSYDAPSTCNGIVQAEFNYTEPNALRKKDPCGGAVASDTGGDGLVSLTEAYQWNLLAMARSAPQLGDPSGLAPSTVPARGNP
jgi:hypothetical protein